MLKENRTGIKTIVLILLSLMFLSLWFIFKPSETKEENTNKKVTLILDKGGVNDGSFNQSAWEGAKKAQEQHEITVKYLESTTDADYASNIETAIDMESDLIIGVGFNLSDAIEKAAINYPEQKFAIVDGSFEEIPSNVTPILFNEKEAGYLAGIATAKTIKDNNFGFVGGFEIPAVINYMEGFKEGLLSVNPKAKLSVQYANSFTDASKGRAIAEQMTTNGISCIMAAAGGVNNGIYEVCSEKNKYAVAVDLPQSNVAPNVIVTSAVKNVGIGVADTIKSLIDNTLKGGKEVIYDINNNGVGYEKTSLISEETNKYIENLNNK